MSVSMSVIVSEQMNRMMLNCAQELALNCVRECASRYNFDAEEAIRFLGLESVKLERKMPAQKEKKEKVRVMKPAFPLPYNGGIVESCCHALRSNSGLYTQCVNPIKKGNNTQFCKGCEKQMSKAGLETPECGTIEQRMNVGLYDYVDPKGKKPVHYTKIMKKLKLTEEMVKEEAGKLNITVDPCHFVLEKEEKKRTPKEEKGKKGRPQNPKMVLEIDDDQEDLFATLVAQANAEENEDEEIIEFSQKSLSSSESSESSSSNSSNSSKSTKKKGKTDEEKEAERLEKEAKKEAERLEKEAKKEEERLAKEAEKKKKEEERLAKEAKKESDRLAKEAEKKKKEEERLAKEAAKKEKEDKKSKKSSSETKQSSSETKQSPSETKQTSSETKKSSTEVNSNQDALKKIKVDDKRYLKSIKTGIIYDIDKYLENHDLVALGKWNEERKNIDFFENEEESDEEDEEDEEEEEDYDL